MTSVPKSCIFIDACVAFAEILEENKDVMDKLKVYLKRRNIPCYISTSAADECTKKLNFTENFFDHVFRTFAEGYFNSCRQQQGKNPSDPITKADFMIFADLFNELRMTMGSVLQKPLRELEKQMVLGVEQMLRQKTKTDFGSFIRLFEGQALVLAAHLRIQKVRFLKNQQGFFKTRNVLPDKSITARLLTNVHSSGRFPFHMEDADNISSAWVHMQSNNEKTIFASFDFRTVISHAKEIFKLINLHCCDPLYVIHYL